MNKTKKYYKILSKEFPEFLNEYIETMKKDQEARKFINNTINKEAFKKYSKELLVTGGKDAARMATYSAIGVIMHDLSLAVVEELKYILKNRKEKTNRELFVHFKERMAKVIEELKKL